MHFDFSKTHLSAAHLAAFAQLAERQDLAGRREALFTGAEVNLTEGRAAEHTAERGEGAAESVERAQRFHGRMRTLIDAVEAEAFGPVRHVLHVGIGGSALGPDLLIDALGRDAGRYETAIVSNVDGAALEEALKHFDPPRPCWSSRRKPSPPPRPCSTPPPLCNGWRRMASATLTARSSR
jgi:glucose-6-phosphate isomerase